MVAVVQVRLIIAGSRGCNPTDEQITAEVARLPVDWGEAGATPEMIRVRIVEVISGDAAGSDMAGERWARGLGIPIHHEPIQEADIRQFGKYLGPRMRNRRMAERGTHAIVFWDGISGGTPDMAIRMLCRGKHVSAVPCRREAKPARPDRQPVRSRRRQRSSPEGQAAPGDG